MRRQTSTGSWVAAVVVVLAVVAAGVFLTRKAMHADQSAAPAAVAPTPATTSSAAVPIRHPIAEAQAQPAGASTAALPPLDQSDDEVASNLERLAGDSPLSLLLVRPQIIARIVATIDAMPGRSLGGFMLPARTPKGAFVTQDVDGNSVIGAGNAARYAPYMRVVEQVDPQALVAWYVHAYPLFQQAYRQLGYPKGYFNDRLIVVIETCWLRRNRPRHRRCGCPTAITSTPTPAWNPCRQGNACCCARGRPMKRPSRRSCTPSAACWSGRTCIRQRRARRLPWAMRSQAESLAVTRFTGTA